MDDLKLFLQGNYYKNLPKQEFLDYRLFEQDSPQWLILLHGTYQCNANCIYCENHVLRDEYNNAIISENMVREIVRKLGPNVKEFTWHGGESLLLPEKLFEAMYEERQKNNFNFNITLQTNGILLTDKVKTMLNKYNIQIGSSFDGLYNTQHRGKASTDALLNLIKNHRNYFQSFINVYTKDNICYLIKNYEYLKKINSKYFQSCIVRENVEEGDNKYLIQDDEAVREVLKYLNYWIYDTNNPILDKYLERQIKRVLGIITVCEDINCIGGWLIIDPFGNITTCGMSGIKNSFCNIKDINSYQDLLINKKFRDTFYKQINLFQIECQFCQWKDACNGGCMALNYEKNHNYKELNKRNCEYNKKLLDGIYNLIKDIDINNKEYNPLFINILKESNYLSLTQIKEIYNRINLLFGKKDDI